jgi:putative sterol carrier protein
VSARASDPTADFFAGLAARGHEPLLGQARGSVRFELTVPGKKTERWLLTIDRGDLSVSRRNARPTCVVRMEKALFERLARGEINAIAAMLRGALRAEGDRELLMRLQRLFPGPDDPGRRS